MQIEWIVINGFLLITLAVIIYGAKKIRNGSEPSNQASFLLISGILLTFIGISYGLWDFDPDNIEDSVPRLLSGMTLAFITSVIGISANILLKHILPIFVKSKKHSSHGQDEQDRFLDNIETIAKNSNEMITHFQTQHNFLANIEKSIGGDGETTLLTNIQKLRTTTQDNLSEINTSIKGMFLELTSTIKEDLSELNMSFKEYAEKQAENNSNALIEALEQVMRDFNTKITEQFGDNFKRLNEAVENLLVWQENYKSFVEKMTEQFEISIKAISDCHLILEKIATSSESFNDSAENLDIVLQNLNTNLIGIEEMSKNAKETFPIINKNINELTTKFSETVELSTNKIKETIDKSTANLEISRLNNDNVVKELSQSLKKQVASIEEENQKYSREVRQFTTNRLNELYNETNKALHEYGNSLVTISNKLAKDYENIAVAFNKISNEVQRGNK
jgi:hypothetical protein